MATMDALAALCWSICATGAGATSHVEPPARLVAQHQNPAQRRTVLALLRHTHLPYSVASDSKLLETSRSLGTRVVPPRRAIAASSAREGEKVRNVRRWTEFLLRKSFRDAVLYPNLVVDHDSGLKNRCSRSHFREIAIANLSLDGGSTVNTEAGHGKSSVSTCRRRGTCR